MKNKCHALEKIVRRELNETAPAIQLGESASRRIQSCGRQIASVGCRIQSAN